MDFQAFAAAQHGQSEYTTKESMFAALAFKAATLLRTPLMFKSVQRYHVAKTAALIGVVAHEWGLTLEWVEAHGISDTFDAAIDALFHIAAAMMSLNSARSDDNPYAGDDLQNATEALGSALYALAYIAKKDHGMTLEALCNEVME